MKNTMTSIGYKINLKKLLSMQLKDNEVIKRSIRVCLQNSSFQISFNLTRDSVYLLNIRPILKKPPVNKRIQKRRRRLDSYYKDRESASSVTTERSNRLEVGYKCPTDLSYCKNAETQTAVKHFYSTACMTEKAIKLNQYQQTHRTFIRNSMCQTECSRASIAVQAGIDIAAHITQTDLVTYSFGTQSELLLYERETQTDDEQKTQERMDDEQSSLVLLLNEIGALLLKQDEVVVNNATLLMQVSNKILCERAQDLASKSQKQKDEHNRRSKMRELNIQKKCSEVQKLSESLQTEPNLLKP